MPPFFDFYCFSKNGIILVCLNLQIFSGLATACVRYLWVVKNDKSKDKLIIRNIIILSLYLSIFYIYLLQDSNLYFKCRYEWEYDPFWDNNIIFTRGQIQEVFYDTRYITVHTLTQNNSYIFQNLIKILKILCRNFYRELNFSDLRISDVAL